MLFKSYLLFKTYHGRTPKSTLSTGKKTKKQTFERGEGICADRCYEITIPAKEASIPHPSPQS